MSIAHSIIEFDTFFFTFTLFRRRSQKKKRETSAVEMSAMEHFGDGDEDSPTAGKKVVICSVNTDIYIPR